MSYLTKGIRPLERIQHQPILNQLRQVKTLERMRGIPRKESEDSGGKA
jgi:hypothetical protein